MTDMGATHMARFKYWNCTRCIWEGQYDETDGVMYRGVDWQHCPSCGAIAIPRLGSTLSLPEIKERLELMAIWQGTGEPGKFPGLDDLISEDYIDGNL